MPNVVQGGREVPRGDASVANTLRGKYSSILRTWTERPTSSLDQKTFLR